MDTDDLSVAASSTAEIPETNRKVPMLSDSSRRLYWTLNGPLENSIQVAPNRYYEPGDVMEPYFRPGDAVAGISPSWHPVSQESLMEPPVTAITVRIECMDALEDVWVELNRDYTDINTDPQQPRAKDVQLEVTTSGEFLTIHDYVSAVHPWLIGLRERIIDTLHRYGVNGPWRPEAKLLVRQFGFRPIDIGREDMDWWVLRHQKPRPISELSAFPLSMAEREAAHLRTIERMKARSAARILELQRLRQEGNN
ncbi:uncharacterized protein LY79DRAFT_645124 [Colletotrichum navitas]|uniref:Uncharacterized protein n=1 Tax=Colletotrichum navitas TaxID=681940 RepID=A0AAD8PIY2_9PEZI|nr:uncharacterized protein LY79DRAFT_645124 [Colletotrichum navitas]KAK1563974.1 hypothetical protein LY79DRAFT_645124 [Colletotrichum navitas]